MQNSFHNIFTLLRKRWGVVNWWPADTNEEIFIGAVLTQNTAWTNVEKAIENMKRGGGASFQTTRRLSAEELADLIRPSGYHNQKSERLKGMVRFIDENYDGNLENLLELPMEKLRDVLLSLKGIGPETADDIILYAAGKPLFVIDAYTKRICYRHHLCAENVSYDELQRLFHENLEEDVELYQEYHALFVLVAKHFCVKRNPLCEDCPLGRLPHV